MADTRTEPSKMTYEEAWKIVEAKLVTPNFDFPDHILVHKDVIRVLLYGQYPNVKAFKKDWMDGHEDKFD